MNIILSGGGTGGHVYPAIAIAKKIKELNPSANILFVGTRAGIESKLVRENGFDIEFISVKGLKRKIDFDNVKRILMALKAQGDVKRIIKKFKPDLVIGTGGYVSGPVLRQASQMGINTVVHEQNSHPGVTNKLLSRTVNLVLTSFEDSHKKFPEVARKKLVMTGNPVRDEILKTTREEARKALNIDSEKKMVLCYGGSGGSQEIDDVIKPLIEELIKIDAAFIFATGEIYFESMKSKLEGLELKSYQRVLPYLDDMANALAASDLVIGSAGAISLAEITAKGKASVIVPKAYTAENHQEYNARSLEKAGASICITEAELTEDSLKHAVMSVLTDDEKLRSMDEASLKMGKPEALMRIYEEIEKYL